MPSTEVLKLSSVGLAAHGPVLSLTLGIGQAVAIVGPAASGKGTLAKRIAAHYGFHHLDTGLLYRGVARAVLPTVSRPDDADQH